MAVSLLKTVNYVWFLCLELAVDIDYAFLPFLSGSVKIESPKCHFLLSPLLDSGFLKYCFGFAHVLSSRFWQLVSTRALSKTIQSGRMSVFSARNGEYLCFLFSKLERSMSYVSLPVFSGFTKMSTRRRHVLSLLFCLNLDFFSRIASYEWMVRASSSTLR